MTKTETPARRQYPALDGVRAIAALAVIGTHVGFASGRSVDNGPLSGLLARLDFGVTLFFLLSGFVIYRPFARAALAGATRPATGPFYARRLARILPAYWVVVIVTLAGLSLRTARPADWFAYLTLTQTYTGHNLDPSLTQMWTLSVELCFYAVVPLLAAVGLRMGRGSWTPAQRQLRAIAALFLISAVANLVGNETSARLHDSLIWLPANLDWFALGMFLAVVSALPPGRPQRWVATVREVATNGGTCWVLGGLILWIATLPIAGSRSLVLPTGWEWTIKHYLYAVAALVLLLPLTVGPEPGFAGFLRRGPLRHLGTISYGIYLWHLPILIALQHLLGYRTFGGHFWSLFLGTVALTLAAATASWLLIEKPLLRAVQRRQRRGSSSASAPAATAIASSTSP